jgi:hypothetical protein
MATANQIRFKKMMAKAQALRKAHPGKAWSACVAAAGKAMRGQKVSGSAKVGAAKKRARTVTVKKSVTRRVKVGKVGAYNPKTRTITTMRGETLAVADVHLRHAREILGMQLGKLAVKQFNAKTKTEKRKVGKEISEIKRRIKNLAK